MDLLIKNVKLPKENEVIWLAVASDGTVKEGYGQILPSKAIEVKLHGELIERDKILEYIEDHENLNIGTLYDVIQDAPTVLEASE